MSKHFLEAQLYSFPDTAIYWRKTLSKATLSHLSADLLRELGEVLVDVSRDDAAALLASRVAVPEGVIFDISEAAHRVAQVGRAAVPRARVAHDRRTYRAGQCVKWARAVIPLSGTCTEDSGAACLDGENMGTSVCAKDLDLAEYKARRHGF